MQISDTQIITPNIVNETRFQFNRESDNQFPLSTDPTVIVPDEFTGGGSSAGSSLSKQDHYELQNYTSIAHGKHLIKFGAKAARDAIFERGRFGFQRHIYFPSLERLPDHANRPG